jgi:phosphatidylethanolamine/phosphatidyl-N-methylethanolamine N-methyltransferase
VRQPVRMGAVAPSSPWLARRLVDEMGLEDALTVVELGPGTGPFTRVISERAHPEALILALELNPRLAAELARRFDRVEIVNDSAERLPEHLRSRGRDHADCVLSGLPFAGFSEDLQRRLLDAVVSALGPGGRFATFAYLHAAWLPPGRRFRRMLESCFHKVERTSTVWRNLPPAFVYRCEK